MAIIEQSEIGLFDEEYKRLMHSLGLLLPRQAARVAYGSSGAVGRVYSRLSDPDRVEDGIRYFLFPGGFSDVIDFVDALQEVGDLVESSEQKVENIQMSIQHLIENAEDLRNWHDSEYQEEAEKRRNVARERECKACRRRNTQHFWADWIEKYADTSWAPDVWYLLGVIGMKAGNGNDTLGSPIRELRDQIADSVSNADLTEDFVSKVRDALWLDLEEKEECEDEE